MKVLAINLVRFAVRLVLAVALGWLLAIPLVGLLEAVGVEDEGNIHGGLPLFFLFASITAVFVGLRYVPFLRFAFSPPHG